MNDTPDNDMLETLKIVREEMDRLIAIEEAGGDCEADGDGVGEYLIRVGASLLCEFWDASGGFDAFSVVAETVEEWGLLAEVDAMKAAETAETTAAMAEREEGANVH